MKKLLLMTALLSLLLLTVVLVWKKSPATRVLLSKNEITVPLAAVSPVEQEQVKPDQQSILNLALPHPDLLMDKKIVLPENKPYPRDLFVKQPKKLPVSVGGRFILEEKPPEPNAAIWDQVKGAEVGITIKTP